MLPRHVLRELDLLRNVLHPCVVSLKEVLQQVGGQTGCPCGEGGLDSSPFTHR